MKSYIIYKEIYRRRIDVFASMALAAGCDFYIAKRLLRHSFGRDVTHRYYIRLGNKELMKSLERYSPLRLIGKHSDKLKEGELWTKYRRGKSRCRRTLPS